MGGIIMRPCKSCHGTGYAPGMEGGLCEDCETRLQPIKKEDAT